MAGSRSDHGDPLELEAGGRTVTISSPGKVMFPEHGETKEDLARYYLAVGEPLMRSVRDLLAEHGMRSFPKTTGNRGLHLYVRVEPGWSSLAVRQAAVAVARMIGASTPR